MKSFACKDLGVDCNFVATGSTEEEVTEKAMAHAQVVHKDLLASMTPDQLNELGQNLVKSIRTVSAA